MKKLDIGLSVILGVMLLSGCTQDDGDIKLKYESFQVELGNPIKKSAEFYLAKTVNTYQSFLKEVDLSFDIDNNNLINNKYEKPGTYQMTLYYKEQIKEFDIVVKDTRVPQIRGDSILYVKTNSQIDYQSLYKVEDYNEVEDLVIDDSQVNLHKEGEYKLYLSVKDIAGNIGKKEVIVRVQDVIRKEKMKDKVLLDIPYYNQLEQNAPNGCETTSMYMALKYKNKIDIDIQKFIDDEPRANSPYDGFSGDPFSGASSMYEYPTIFPTPLVNYGNKYTLCRDITGATVDDIKIELSKDNPVIVYVTGGLKTAIPKEYYFGTVTGNLHIVLLNGYDEQKKSFSVLDPIDENITSISYSDFLKAYDLMKFAVVIE